MDKLLGRRTRKTATIKKTNRQAPKAARKPATAQAYGPSGSFGGKKKPTGWGSLAAHKWGK